MKTKNSTDIDFSKIQLPSKPDEVIIKTYIGKSYLDLKDYCEKNKVRIRIIKINNYGFAGTADFRLDRINVELDVPINEIVFMPNCNPKYPALDYQATKLDNATVIDIKHG